MTTSSINFESFHRNSLFNFRVVLRRIRLFPILISKVNWLWNELPLKLNFFKPFFQFMTKNPERRLGYDNEELNIKRHHFFAPIDWAKLERREIKPEFVPDGSKLNFEKDFTEEEPTLRIVFKQENILVTTLCHQSRQIVSHIYGRV